MYRFLTIQDITTYVGLFASKKAIMQRTMRMCSFCNFHHSKLLKPMVYIQKQTANSSTNPLEERVPVKRKKKQKNKVYTELLEVTDHVTNNKTATVQKLNMVNLSMLVSQPNATTDEVKKKKTQKCKRKYSVENVNIDNAALNDEEMLMHCETEQEGAFAEIEPALFSNPNFKDFNNLQFYRETDTEKLATHPILQNTDFHDQDDINNKDEYKELLMDEKNTKDTKTNKFKSSAFYEDKMEWIMAHVDVCIRCGKIRWAAKILHHSRHKLRNTKTLPNNCIHLYHLLLAKYASQGELTKALQIYSFIKEDSLRPTAQTYANLLEAYAKSKLAHQNTKILKTINSDMTTYNISYNDVFTKSKFRGDEKDHVLAAIRLLQPDFTPSYPPPDREYNCSLLKKIPLSDKYVSPAEGLFTLEELKNNVKTQIEVECLQRINVNSIQKSSTDKEHREKINALEEQWKHQLAVGFEKNLNYLIQKELRMLEGSFIMHPFLQVLPKEDYIEAMLIEVKQLAQNSHTYSPPLSFLWYQLGRTIYERVLILVQEQNGILTKTIDIYLKYLEWYLHPGDKSKSSSVNNRSVWQNLEYENEMHYTSLHNPYIPWPRRLLCNIGKLLYNIIFEEVKVDPRVTRSCDISHAVPAFYVLYRNYKVHLMRQVKPHPIVTQLYRDLPSETLIFKPTFLPSYIPPRPWITETSGGYLLTPTVLMRLKCPLSPVDQDEMLKPRTNLYPVFDSLNQLSSVPWKINTPILDIIIKVFQDGGSPELSVPQPPSVLSEPKDDSNETEPQRPTKRSARLLRKRKKDEMYSIWCDTLYKLSLANHFRNKIFWLPHNMDFRGRVYPVPPHLNHLTSDLGRSILLFAKGKPLGPDGLKWLKIHTINLTGFKKGCSLSDILQYADENVDNILDSARNPLTGKMWWAKSDEPWQTLAACMEIGNALSSPDIEAYVSHFPVHQDGSCNGLQHYAALGRDVIGGESVNLCPSDKPQDVYTAVASLIEKRRQEDVENNNEIAKMLEGYIGRKVIKQTVMTTVYGVTKYGAKHQILKQLKEKKFPEKHLWHASTYLAMCTFDILRTMFESAKQIQDWFTNCAGLISSVCRENIEWFTPLGLPITQIYIKKDSPITKTKLIKVDILKHKNAFAPNFIHSLDSTHMMLTSLHCGCAGLTFVSVHDCFWTHACTVSDMSKICREQFVALHSEAILENLSNFFVEHYLNENRGKKLKLHRDEYMKLLRTFTSVPKSGALDINNVLKSTYFFS